MSRIHRALLVQEIFSVSIALDDKCCLVFRLMPLVWTPRHCLCEADAHCWRFFILDCDFFQILSSRIRELLSSLTFLQLSPAICFLVPLWISLRFYSIFSFSPTPFSLNASSDNSFQTCFLTAFPFSGILLLISSPDNHCLLLLLPFLQSTLWIPACNLLNTVISIKALPIKRPL